jgi:hypothetical protein
MSGFIKAAEDDYNNLSAAGKATVDVLIIAFGLLGIAIAASFFPITTAIAAIALVVVAVAKLKQAWKDAAAAKDDAMRADIAKAQEQADASKSDPGGSYATGGPVRGPGTGTSDSIPAWLSAGEFVVRADGSNLAHAFNFFGEKLMGFAQGGLVPKIAQSARTLGGTTTVNLTIDGQKFSGLTASEDIAASLTRFAVSRQMSSTGRKPSWVK